MVARLLATVCLVLLLVGCANDSAGEPEPLTPEPVATEAREAVNDPSRQSEPGPEEVMKAALRDRAIETVNAFFSGDASAVYPHLTAECREKATAEQYAGWMGAFREKLSDDLGTDLSEFEVASAVVRLRGRRPLANGSVDFSIRSGTGPPLRRQYFGFQGWVLEGTEWRAKRCDGRFYGSGDARAEQRLPLHLYVSNQSSTIYTVDITVWINGEEVVADDFDVENQHNWILYTFELGEGPHTLRAESRGGDAITELEFEFPAESWAVLDYWRYEGDPGYFSWHQSERKFSFD